MIEKCKPEDIPYLTTEQMIEVDRAMIKDFKIELIQMMENAGRNLASLARERFLDGDPSGKRVVVLVGTGGNGGGALTSQLGSACSCFCDQAGIGFRSRPCAPARHRYAHEGAGEPSGRYGRRADARCHPRWCHRLQPKGRPANLGG